MATGRDYPETALAAEALSTRPVERGTQFVRENRSYWSQRSQSYSLQHRGELESDQHARWQRELLDAIASAYPGIAPEELSVLDAGCGPGFFSIILAEAGFRVTSIDYTPAMLEQAQRNAGDLAGRIEFRQMNAEALEFPDESFDIVVSRNLTWDLPHPCRAYAEWTRVLKRGGLLLNFDANWYGYLYDEEKREAYEDDRINTAQAGLNDRIIHTNVGAMEKIAREVPLSHKSRPAWDVETLQDLDMDVHIDLGVFKRVWSKEERVNHASTPLFRVLARKGE